jgi:signal transduction histidine kinase
MERCIPLRCVPTDLRPLLRSSLAVLHSQAKAADIGLRVIVDDDVPAAVSIDPDKIAWATTVLVGNAMRYVRHGSRGLTGGSITVHVRNTGDTRIAIAVEDDGPGMPPARVATLFADTDGQPRAGLGLLMVRDVVMAHGGQIGVTSETDPISHGTTIVLTLPVQ